MCADFFNTTNTFFHGIFKFEMKLEMKASTHVFAIFSCEYLLTERVT